jgi:hypothetical protein
MATAERIQTISVYASEPKRWYVINQSQTDERFWVWEGRGSFEDLQLIAGPFKDKHEGLAWVKACLLPETAERLGHVPKVA